MTIIFFLFQVLSILYLFDQEMEPEQAEPPPHSHGQQPLSAVSNRTMSRVAQRSSCVARVLSLARRVASQQNSKKMT